MIDWRRLELFYPYGDQEDDAVTDIVEKHQYLQEFRETGRIVGVFFERINAPHEDPEDPRTWGPKSPKNVDWFGFREDR